MIDRPTFNYDNQGNAIVPAASDNLPADPATPTALINATEDGRTMPVQSNDVPADYLGTKRKCIDGIMREDWSIRPRDPETGRYIAKASDAAIIQSTGISPEVAAVLSSHGDLAGAVDTLRDGMSRIWGSDAATVAEWAGELSHSVQGKAGKVIMRYPDLSGRA